MSRFIVTALLLASLAPWSRAHARDYRSMVCQVWGCSADTVRLDELSGYWSFEMTESLQTSYLLDHDFTLFLRKAKLIGEKDRADYVLIEIAKKYCRDDRAAVGALTCRGPVDHATIRVRLGERYEAGGKSTYVWKTVSSPATAPWTFELRSLPAEAPASLRWAIQLAAGSVTQDFFPFYLNECRLPIASRASRVRTVTCSLDADQGRGLANLRQHDSGSFHFGAQETGDSLIDLRFTRLLEDLGVIELGEHVSSIAYFGRKESCEPGADVRNVTCREKLGTISVTARRLDSQGTIHERRFEAQLSTVEVSSRRTASGVAWEWTLTKDGKYASTGYVEQRGCLYGEQIWE